MDAQKFSMLFLALSVNLKIYHEKIKNIHTKKVSPNLYFTKAKT